MQKLATKTHLTERKFVNLQLQKKRHVDFACSHIVD